MVAMASYVLQLHNHKSDIARIATANVSARSGSSSLILNFPNASVEADEDSASFNQPINRSLTTLMTHNKGSFEVKVQHNLLTSVSNLCYV